MIQFRPQYKGSLQRPASGEDALGQPAIGFVEVDKPWADIRVMGGLESIKAGAVASTIKASVRLWYRTDVSASWRYVHNGTVYSVIAVLPDKLARIHIDLVCEVTA
jgi:SPP1 family predicted phage head-tail adaptor